MNWGLLALLVHVPLLVAAGHPSLCQPEIDITHEAVGLFNQTISDWKHEVQFVPQNDMIVDDTIRSIASSLRLVEEYMMYESDAMKIYSILDTLMMVRSDIVWDLKPRIGIVIDEELLALESSTRRVSIALAKCIGRSSLAMLYRKRGWVAGSMVMSAMAWAARK